MVAKIKSQMRQLFFPRSENITDSIQAKWNNFQASFKSSKTLTLAVQVPASWVEVRVAIKGFQLFFYKKNPTLATLKFPFTEIMEVGETAETRFPVKAPAENRQLLTGGKFLLANRDSCEILEI